MKTFVTKTPIEKGFSNDKKYLVADEHGKPYFLRISSLDQKERINKEFELSTKAFENGVVMSEPLSLELRENGVYSLHSWIDGSDAESVIDSFSDAEQYNYGFESGKMLKLIHQIQAPEGIEPWEIRFGRKMDQKIQAYEECPVKYKSGQCFLDYISSHRHLIKGRPTAFQHGDYHIGNMMIGKDKKLYIIDYNRFDFGDPWEEFNRIVWCAQSSPLFSTGMVNGYFDNNVPLEFWELLALYISSNTLGSARWAIRFGPGETEIMVKQAEDILSWYNNMTTPIPSWYMGVISN